MLSKGVFVAICISRHIIEAMIGGVVTRILIIVRVLPGLLLLAFCACKSRDTEIVGFHADSLSAVLGGGAETLYTSAPNVRIRLEPSGSQVAARQVALLRADLVERLHWLTDTQLLDAIAVGQFTPGPVFTTATFIGYLVKGWPGAVVATLGIFLPSFVLVAASGLLLKRLQKSAVARSFLDGVNVAALALMATVTWNLGRSALVDWLTIVIALVSLFLLLQFRVNSFWLVLAGALAGLGKWWFS